MKKLLLILSLIAGTNIYSQAPAIEWQHTYGGAGFDAGTVVRPTMDGGYIMAGYSLSTIVNGNPIGNHGSSDFLVIKLDPLGNVEWQHDYGGSGLDMPMDMCQTVDSGYVVVGYSNSADGDLTTNHGSTDYWVIKLNNSGVLQWQKSLGGTNTERAYGVTPTLDGGYAIIGCTYTTNGSGDVISPTNGTIDYWLCKLDFSGNLQWQKCLGGSQADLAFKLLQNPDSSYIICGYSFSVDGMVTGNHGYEDYWIIKTSPQGNLLWERSLGGSADDGAYGLASTSDGGYIVCGSTSSVDGDVSNNNGNYDSWVVKLDASGYIQWEKAFGGSGYELGISVQQDNDGGYVLLSLTNTLNDGDVMGNHGEYDYWVVKMDATGNLQWQKCLGGSLDEGGGTYDLFANITVLPGNKYILAGSTYSTDGDVIGSDPSLGDNNFWLVKLDNCSPVSGFSDTDSICYGSIYYFDGMQLISSGTYSDTLISVNGCDSIISLDLYVAPPLNPVITPSGNMLSTGSYAFYQWLLNGSIIPGANSANLIITGGGQYSVAVGNSIGCMDTSVVFNSTLGMNEQETTDVVVFPNPADEIITISSFALAQFETIQIYNVNGQPVLSANINAQNLVNMDVSDLSPGVYIIKITTGGANEMIFKMLKN